MRSEPENSESAGGPEVVHGHADSEQAADVPFFAVDPEVLKREKARARKLRDSPWWKRKRASGRCHYCGRTFKPAELTMDHLIPVVRGGRSVKENLVPACKECNNEKKYLLPAEWDQYLRRQSEKTR